MQSDDVLNFTLKIGESFAPGYINATKLFTSSDPLYCPVYNFTIKTSDIDPYDTKLYNPSEDLL